MLAEQALQDELLFSAWAANRRSLEVGFSETSVVHSKLNHYPALIQNRRDVRYP
jgi:hypothetical protein